MLSLRSEVHPLFAGKGSKIQRLMYGASTPCSHDERRKFPMELSHTRGIAPAPSIPGVIRRTMSRWLLMAVGASLVLSALFPSRVVAAPWSLAQSLNQLLMVYGQFSDLAASAPYATQVVGAFVLFHSPQEASGPV